MTSIVRGMLFVACLSLAGVLRAADAHLLYCVVAPAPAGEPGSTLQLQVAVLNPSDVAMTLEFPDACPGEIVTPDHRWPIEARSTTPMNTSTRSVSPRGFVICAVSVTLPRTLAPGGAILELTLPGAAVRVPIEIAGALSQVAAGGPATGSRTETVQRPTNSLARSQSDALRRVYTDHLAPNEPIYFIAGKNDSTAKFQFSFKYKLLDFRDVAPQRMRRTLQFAFTQRSLWDIGGESSPFYDTSYMPELMYEALAPETKSHDGWFSLLGVQAAFKHESNGRDGPMSRSLNTVYARPAFLFGQPTSWHLILMPEVFAYLDDLDDNPDLKDYRGYGRLHAVIGRSDGPALMATAWAGRDFNHGSVQLDLTVPIRTKLLKFETYLLIQYFNGYGESLRAYREKTETVRGGMSIIR